MEPATHGEGALMNCSESIKETVEQRGDELNIEDEILS
jgi:hypothetical protein